MLPFILSILVISMTTSVFLMNLAWVLLLAWWLFSGHWREKWESMKRNRLLQAFLVLAVVHALWLIGSQDMERALFLFQKRLPLVVVPLVVLTSRPLKVWEQHLVGSVYCITVLVVSVIGFVRYLTIPDLPYREIVPYISHIRYGLNACLVIVLLVYCGVHYRRGWLIAVNGVATVWLVYVLLLLHAYTSFVILLLIPLVLLIVYGGHLSKNTRLGAWGVLAVVVLSLVGVSCCYYRQYYPAQQAATYPVVTANGNAYDTPMDDFMENGHYLYHEVCTQELVQQWPRYSDYPYDSVTATGYPLSSALLRYLNGMGVSKDSVGLTHLSSDDIDAIELGVGNPVYCRLGLRRLYYTLFFEYDNYRFYHHVAGFTMLQRFELWNNAWHIFLQHPLWGVGTGDVLSQCQDRMQSLGSPLAAADLNTHNQYLNLLVAFGSVGFLLIVLAFARGWIVSFRVPYNHRSLLFVSYLCILLVSFISEDTLNTAAGVFFASVPMVLLQPAESGGNGLHD